MLFVLASAILAVEKLGAVRAGLFLADEPYLFAAAAAHGELFLKAVDSVEVGKLFHNYYLVLIIDSVKVCV